MKRSDMIAAMDDPGCVWDVIIIGGGATGLGAAVESVTRGHRTLLLESHDFAKGTSSRSTKLIHGGVRYLRQGQIGMVRQSLRERQRLLRNAPHLVHPLEFVMPTYRWCSREFYYAGLRVYDVLAGNFWKGRARCLSSTQVKTNLGGLNATGLKGGVQYVDGQFDDSRLAITLAQTAADHGAVVVNYMPVVRLQCDGGRIQGVVAQDSISHREYSVRGRVVINATGVFAEKVLDLEANSESRSPALSDHGVDVRPNVRPSQGTHLVLDAEFLPGLRALMIPETEDGRVLFAIPWHGKVLLGTTDVAVSSVSHEPRAMASEVDYLLRYAGMYLNRKPTRKDIRSCFSGLRPLVAAKSGTSATSKLSREHEIYVGPSGMITVIGGKWTTYRQMGEELINHAESIASLIPHASKTASLPLHGSWSSDPNSIRSEVPSSIGHMAVYGTDADAIYAFEGSQNLALNEKIHPDLPFLKAEVVWAVREEMALTVEDILARRTRALFLDAAAAIEAAPEVASILRRELRHDEDWEADQIASFQLLASGYLTPE